MEKVAKMRRTGCWFLLVFLGCKSQPPSLTPLLHIMRSYRQENTLGDSQALHVVTKKKKRRKKKRKDGTDAHSPPSNSSSSYFSSDLTTAASTLILFLQCLLKTILSPSQAPLKDPLHLHLFLNSLPQTIVPPSHQGNHLIHLPYIPSNM